MFFHITGLIKNINACETMFEHLKIIFNYIILNQEILMKKIFSFRF